MTNPKKKKNTHIIVKSIHSSFHSESKIYPILTKTQLLKSISRYIRCILYTDIQ